MQTRKHPHRNTYRPKTRQQKGATPWNIAASALLLLMALARPIYGHEDVTTHTALDDLLDRNKLIWKTSRSDFMSSYRDTGFYWESADWQVARVANKPLMIFGLPICEARIHFQQDRPRLLVFSLYNRGDAGDLDRDLFKDLLEKTITAMDQWAGTAAKPVDDPFNTTGVKRHAVSWTTPLGLASLVWSFSTKNADGHLTYRSEYIRLEMAPTNGPNTTAKKSQQNGFRGANAVLPALLKERVKTEPAGDVRINGIPMIDQGQKGYCAAAAMERVMRYYGIQADQHEIAQIVSSSSEEGTNSGVMIDALKRVSSKLGCKIKVLDELDVEPFKKLVTQYNHLAKRNKRQVIMLGSMIVVSDVYDHMDLDLLREVRLKQQGDFQRYQVQVGQFVNEGIPLVWSVIAGKVHESPPVKTVGGHLRLIIGYNAKKGEVLYTDTWGAGHELKRMKMEDAWAITQGLLVIEPRWKTR